MAFESPSDGTDTSAVLLKRFSQDLHLLLVPDASLALVPGQLADPVVPMLGRHSLYRPSSGYRVWLIALLLELSIVGPGVLEHSANLGIVLLKTSLNQAQLAEDLAEGVRADIVDEFFEAHVFVSQRMEQGLVLSELPAGPPRWSILVLRIVVHLAVLVVVSHRHRQWLYVDRDRFNLSQDILVLLLFTNKVVVVFNHLRLLHFLFFCRSFAW